MLERQTVIDSIRDGETMADVMEYVAGWIMEARNAADALDAAYFAKGLPEDSREAVEHFKGAAGCFHALEMTLEWIQMAVEETGKCIFRKEMEEEERERRLEEKRLAEREAAQAAAGAGNILPITDGKRGRKK